MSRALAAIAPPSAVFVSPWTTTAAGRCAANRSSRRRTRSPICCPAPSTSDSQHHIRRGEAQLIEEDVG